MWEVLERLLGVARGQGGLGVDRRGPGGDLGSQGGFGGDLGSRWKTAFSLFVGGREIVNCLVKYLCFQFRVVL